LIVIDFETRSNANLKKTGAWRYGEDPSTEVLCLGYCVENEPPQLWIPGEEMPEVFSNPQSQNFIAHNVLFEKAIWRNVMVKDHGWPDIPEENWTCSAAMAAALALPRSLKDAGFVMGLDKQKNEAGHRMMLKLCKPKIGQTKWDTKPEDFKTLFEYCLDDIHAGRELYLKLRELSDSEREIWQLDQKMNLRGVHIDRDLVEAAVGLSSEYVDRLNKKLTILTRGAVKKASEIAKMTDWINTQKVSLKSIAKEPLADALKSDDLPPQVREVLQIRQDIGRTSTAKYSTILEALCSDGRLRNLLVYHGASTGRWAGQGVQPQNFPKRYDGDAEQCIRILKKRDLEGFQLCYPNVMETLSQILRGVFVATPGKTLYGGDYNAIEARVLLWLAGDHKGVELFRQNKDIYVDLAKTIYEREGIDKAQRELGKRGILGCGYGMGWEKFIETCKTYGDLVIEKSLAERVIKAYRSKYYAVCRFWWDQEAAAIEAVRTKRVVKKGMITWGVTQGFLFCKLPSGRVLAYFRPRLQNVLTPWGEDKIALTYRTINAKTKKWERVSTYGGKIAENITQAVARDLIAFALLKAEDYGYEVLLSIHDEILAESTGAGKLCFQAIMESLPPWAEGLPIKAEIWSGTRYMK